jgi:GMP synthase-like glutamine amidotransferase
MKLAVIDNYVKKMPGGRSDGFRQALADWEQDYEFIRYDQIRERTQDLQQCRGIILSGSGFDLTGPGNKFARDVYLKMVPEFELILSFLRPVLGICFGHQLMAVAEEFDSRRMGFGDLAIATMEIKEDKLIRQVVVNSPALFLDPGRLWAQFNHKLEVLPSLALHRHFNILAASRECPVDIMQHKSRPWVGVQFHPEVGMPSVGGDVDKHEEAIRDGHDLIRHFARYCLR